MFSLTLPKLFILLPFILLLLPIHPSLAQEVVEADHQAHSKPGGPYFAVDWDGDGLETVTLDATESHTHYFDLGPPVVSGTVVLYEWFSVRTGSKLLETDSPYLTARFFVGYTVLQLVVTDNTGDQSNAYTYVAVREPLLSENLPPSVSEVVPNKGPTYGGDLVKIHGDGFYNNPIVFFGDVRVKPDVIGNTELHVRAPAVAAAATVQIYVTTGFGTSGQVVTFEYVVSSGNPIKFKQTNVKDKNGDEFSIPEITSLKLGPDGLYYAGALDGFIYVLQLDRSLIVQSKCQSQNAGPNRSILGLAFNPNEIQRPVRVYVSTSTLYWKSKDTEDTWDNGKVEVWTKAHSGDCLSHSENVITGLPVSAHDHGVNGLLFDSDGSLFVAMGGTTNAGVHLYEDNLGGLAESALSGAVLRFDLTSPSFDGKIIYLGRTNPGTANIYSGSAEVYSAGLRNVFGIARHSNGKIYGLDNGPNNGFGLAATGCDTAGRQVAFADKLVHLKKDAYYGHPNWNRGRFDTRQCTFIGADVPGNEPIYTGPMAILDSSTNGIVEYTANTFNGKLRGHLLLSKLSWTGPGTLKSAKLDTSGTLLQEDPQELFPESGLAIEMGPYGELLMPKVKQAKILGLIPDESNFATVHVIAVTPRRGPKRGGNTVMITGNGFTSGMKIYFGSQECTAYGSLTGVGTSIHCLVPPLLTDVRSVPVIAVSGGGQSESEAGADYEYMEG